MGLMGMNDYISTIARNAPRKPLPLFHGILSSLECLFLRGHAAMPEEFHGGSTWFNYPPVR